MMMEYISVYATYDPLNQETLNKMVKRVQEIASAFKESEDKAKAAFTMVTLFFGLVLLGALASGK